MRVERVMAVFVWGVGVEVPVSVFMRVRSLESPAAATVGFDDVAAAA